jgi:fatty-acyl-CoA synthase
MLSYSRGPDAPLLEQTIHDTFARTAARLPETLAIVVRHQNVRLTFRQLSEEVERVARGLAGLGLEAGDRVGIWSTSCLEWILLQLACARIGTVLVNVNPAYRAWELRFVLHKSRIRALFLWERDARADYRAILAEAREGQSLNLEQVVYLGGDSWSAMLAGGREVKSAPAGPEDVANIQYTSGTTGSPKGVLLTHHNLVNNGNLMGQRFKATERDRICVPVPLYHCFGCVIGAMVCYTRGSALLFPGSTFDAGETLRTVHEERATALYGVPTMFIAELGHPEFAKFDLSSLRTGMMAGAPCPIEIMKRVMREMHCAEMVIGYGQTESSPVITMSNTDDPLEVRASTVGQALPNTEVKIVSQVTGETLPVGQQGELCARGYMVMKGYDEEPEATARAVDAEGWLHTGDLAVMREDQRFRITGRAKDMIIRGGENIYPREVEEFLYTHPKIMDVQIVGLPDQRLGETLVAWIRLKPGLQTTEEEIRQFCCGKIAHFKVPQYIRFVDEFPMTVTGKIQKFRIREIEIQERGLEAAAKIQTA